MIIKLKSFFIIALLISLLLGLAAVPYQPFLNWGTARSLRKELNPQKRIVLLNTTLTYDPEYWNSEYLREALRADTQVERRFIAALIRDRFNSQASRKLRGLLSAHVDSASRSNLLAVISELERTSK